MDFFPELTLNAFFNARKTIAGVTYVTPIIDSQPLEMASGHNVFLKLENLQRTGSFKLRGATNRIMNLTEEEMALGVVTVSSGNHGRAVSFLAGNLSVPTIVCVSEFVPAHKIEVIENLGAEVVVVGKDYDEADAHARKIVEEKGMTWIDPFDDPYVIAGQGTIGLEILENVPEIQTAIVPASGGGLISGIAMALKLSNPNIRVYGVTMERGPAMYLSLKAGELVPVVEEETLADALMGGLGDENQYTFRICQEYVDEIVLVSEEAIARAMAFAFHEHHIVVEGGGAVGIAALMEGLIDAEGDTVVVISGGNVDPEVLMRVLRENS